MSQTRRPKPPENPRRGAGPARQHLPRSARKGRLPPGPAQRPRPGRSLPSQSLTEFWDMTNIHGDLKFQNGEGAGPAAPWGERMSVSQVQPKSRAAGSLYGPIEADLDACEEIYARHIASPRPGVARLIDHLAHYRGKRLRPALLLL